jgi:hypothetical protein
LLGGQMFQRLLGIRIFDVEIHRHHIAVIVLLDDIRCLDFP